MKIAFDASPIDLDRAGSGNYARQIVAHVAQHPDVEATFRLRSGAGTGGSVTRRLKLLWQDLVWSPFLLPWIAGFRGADILHCTGLRAPLFSRIPCVVTIHDVYPVHNPQAFPLWWSWYFRWVVAAAAKRVDCIITSSEFSAGEICGAWGIDRERVQVIPYGVSPAFERPPPSEEARRVVEALGLPASFFLFVGSMEPRKNIPGLLRAMEKLRAEGRDCRLVLVGPAGWRNREIRRLADRGVEEGWLFRPGFVDDAVLAALYATSRALVMPSFYEGFGFPVIEAMSCGCAVVAGRAGSLPEVTGDAGLLVDPHDTDGIAAAMARIDDDDELRASLVAQGREQARRFRWDRCADETVTLYRELLAPR